MENKLDKIEMAGKDLIRYYCPDYTFIWDRSVRRKGQCRRRARQIGISKPLAELNTFESMLLTVIHEIAHALTGGGHGQEWRRVCLDLGGDGRTYYDANNTVIPSPKWVLWIDGKPSSIKRVRKVALYNPHYEWKALEEVK